MRLKTKKVLLVMFFSQQKTKNMMFFFSLYQISWTILLEFQNRQIRSAKFSKTLFATNNWRNRDTFLFDSFSFSPPSPTCLFAKSVKQQSVRHVVFFQRIIRKRTCRLKSCINSFVSFSLTVLHTLSFQRYERQKLFDSFFTCQ